MFQLISLFLDFHYFSKKSTVFKKEENVPKLDTLQGKTVVSPRTTSISCELVNSSGSSKGFGPAPCIRFPFPVLPLRCCWMSEELLLLLECNLLFSVLSFKEGANWRKGKRCWPARLSSSSGCCCWHRPEIQNYSKIY